MNIKIYQTPYHVSSKLKYIDDKLPMNNSYENSNDQKLAEPAEPKLANLNQHDGEVGEVGEVEAVEAVETVEAVAVNAEETVHPLNDRWWLWTHGMKDEDWSVSSYKRLGDQIATIEQFLGLNRKLLDCIADSMFFLMRHGPGDDDTPICPMWEDPYCIDGGAWKFKVTRSDAAEAWTEIAIRLIGETISKIPGEILGVSISPKKTFVTIRVWNKNAKKNDPKQLCIPDSEYFRNVIYDVHRNYKDQPEQK